MDSILYGFTPHRFTLLHRIPSRGSDNRED